MDTEGEGDGERWLQVFHFCQIIRKLYTLGTCDFDLVYGVWWIGFLVLSVRGLERECGIE